MVEGDLTVTGKYSVVRSVRRKRHAMIVYLRDAGPKGRPLIPDAVSFARALDLHRRDAGFESIGVLHWWVSSYLSTEHEPEIAVAEDVVSGVAGVITGPSYPVPGPHCTGCESRACQNQFDQPLR